MNDWIGVEGVLLVGWLLTKCLTVFLSYQDFEPLNSLLSINLFIFRYFFFITFVFLNQVNWASLFSDKE